MVSLILKQTVLLFCNWPLKTALQQLRHDERYLEAQQVCGWAHSNHGPLRNSPLELPQKVRINLFSEPYGPQ